MDVTFFRLLLGSDLLLDFFLDVEDISARDIHKLKQRNIRKAADGGKDDSISSVFEKIQGLCDENVVAGTQAVYQFNITDHGTWFLDLKTGGGTKL